MPCDSRYMYGSETGPSYKDAFCSACSALEAAGLEVPPAAAELWELHKQEDQKRIHAEVASERKAQLRQSGLEKLTSAERDALGLRRE